MKGKTQALGELKVTNGLPPLPPAPGAVRNPTFYSFSFWHQCCEPCLALALSWAGPNPVEKSNGLR